MRKLLIVIGSLMMTFSGTAQYQGYAAVKDIAKFKQAFAESSSKITSIQSDFVQEKNLAMLTEKITSKGKFWFKKDSRVRMEYTAPFKYLMILNKEKVYIKDGQNESKVSTKSNKVFQQINKIMIDCMQGTALDNADFQTRLFENGTSSMVELTPVAKGMKALFKAIIVVIDKKDYTVSSINMQELSGDNTILRFTNKEINTAIADALFTIN